MDQTLTILRGDRAWSTWNAAILTIDEALERAGLPRHSDARWMSTRDSLSFRGTEAECDAVAAALPDLGLAVNRDNAAPP